LVERTSEVLSQTRLLSAPTAPSRCALWRIRAPLTASSARGPARASGLGFHDVLQPLVAPHAPPRAPAVPRPLLGVDARSRALVDERERASLASVRVAGPGGMSRPLPMPVPSPAFRTLPFSHTCHPLLERLAQQRRWTSRRARARSVAISCSHARCAKGHARPSPKGIPPCPFPVPTAQHHPPQPRCRSVCTLSRGRRAESSEPSTSVCRCTHARCAKGHAHPSKGNPTSSLPRVLHFLPARLLADPMDQYASQEHAESEPRPGRANGARGRRDAVPSSPWLTPRPPPPCSHHPTLPPR
jgi:hypothetical protein